MASACIAVIGSLMVDNILITNHIPDPGETYPANEYHKKLGGKGANAALAAHRSCHPNPSTVRNLDGDGPSAGVSINVRMIGAVGKDANGAQFKSALQDNGIDISGILEADDKDTAMTFIMVEEDSRENRILTVAGATAAVVPDNFTIVEDLGHGVRPDLVISQLEMDVKTVERALELAAQAGIDFLLNAAPASNLLLREFGYITHLLVNETEAAILSGRYQSDVNEHTWEDIAQEFLSDGVKNVVITLGAAGAYYATTGKAAHVPAFRITPVDPTGAGDTFTGAYASEYVRQKTMQEEWDIEKAVVRACKAAALTVASLGAQEGIPWANEIDEASISNEIAALTVSDTSEGRIANESDIPAN